MSTNNSSIKTIKTFFGGTLIVAVGDITRFEGGAIVNAANSGLLGGGGVDGAIHRAGGPEILAACRALRAGPLKDGLPPGRAISTCPGRLNVRRVIHTVGPVWRGGSFGEAATLASCYAESVAVAADEDLDSVAFPAISTGVYGFPKELAAGIAWSTVCDFFARGDESRVKTVWFVFFSTDDAEIFLKANHLG